MSTPHHTNTDPTLEEMRELIFTAMPDTDEFDREEAIWWFAANYHGGQWSNLYAALCASPYTPSPLHHDCTPGDAGEAYCVLEAFFGGVELEACA